MRDSKKRRDIHEEAIRNFDRIQEALYAEREQSLNDRRFYSVPGAQWEGDLSEQFENKPRFEVNKVHLAVMRIINEYRNNRVTVDFLSKDGSPNDEMADVCDGLFRADEQDSGAEEAYDNGFEEAVGGGFGAIRITSSYEDEEDDENEKQRIRIEPIYDADTSVFFDLDAKRQDKADARYCFVMYSMTPEAFEDEYDKDISSVNKAVSDVEYDWYTPDMVFIAEYYVMEEVKDTIHVFQNITGDEERYCEEDFEENPELLSELNAIGTQEVRQKKIKKRAVHKYIFSGNEILEDCGVIAGRNIPIIPVYGKRWVVDSVERCMGHVRLVKDSQRLKNMLMSQLAEISSLSTVSKPIYTPEQVAGLEQMHADDNIKNYPYLLVNSMTDAAGNMIPSGPVGYTKVPEIPPALAALLQIVDIDMKELLGSGGEADKMLSHVSGKAHELIQKRIDGQAFIYMSNFSKAIKRIGEVWLSMAKDLYVEKGRKMKTVNKTGQMQSVELMQPGLGQHGELEAKNDLSRASFDVIVDVGPSSASQREATVGTLTNMLAITQDPETIQVLQSMVMMNMEGEGISEVRDFYRKKLLNMGALKPTEEEAAEMAKEAESKEPTAEEKAYEGMAAEAQAKAVKTKSEVVKVMTSAELDRAKTAETLSKVDLAQRNAVAAALDREEEIKKQQEAQYAAQQQQLAQIQQQQMQQPEQPIA